MNKIRFSSWTKIIFIAILILLIQEAECRRKILKGRKTLTRYYFQKSPIPGWAVVLTVALCELLIGGILYSIMRFFIIDQKIQPRFTSGRREKEPLAVTP